VGLVCARPPPQKRTKGGWKKERRKKEEALSFRPLITLDFITSPGYAAGNWERNTPKKGKKGKEGGREENPWRKSSRHSSLRLSFTIPRKRAPGKEKKKGKEIRLLTNELATSRQPLVSIGNEGIDLEKKGREERRERGGSRFFSQGGGGGEKRFPQKLAQISAILPLSS